MPPGGTQCCFHLNSAVLSLCEFGCIRTTLCYGISFGMSLVDIVCQLSSLFTILVHIRCQVCDYEPQILYFLLFFYQSMRCKVHMPFVPLIWS